MKRTALFAALLLALLAPGAAGADPGITAPLKLAAVGPVSALGIDRAGRIYVASRDLSVWSADGASVARWPLEAGSRIAVLPNRGVVTAAPGARELTHWTPYGAVVARWTLPSPPYSFAADPGDALLVRDGSLRLKRFTPDGVFTGWSPFPAGEASVAPDGKAWIVHATAVAGYTSDGLLLGDIGRECPIGGEEPPCSFDPFSGSGLYAAATSHGVLVADPGFGVLHGFTPSGGASFTCPLRGVTAIAARDRTVILAVDGAVYTATLTGSSPICRSAPLRVEAVRVRGRRLAFALTRRARVHVELHRVRSLDCAARGIVPRPAEAGCSALGRLRSVRTGSFARGAHRISLPRMEAGRWLLTVHAGDAARASVRFSTTSRARAAARVRGGGAAHGS